LLFSECRPCTKEEMTQAYCTSELGESTKKIQNINLSRFYLYDRFEAIGLALTLRELAGVIRLAYSRQFLSLNAFFQSCLFRSLRKQTRPPQARPVLAE
jgi:hypothetical protein